MSYGAVSKILRRVKDQKQRIWCNHCDRNELQVGDMDRHYRCAGHPNIAIERSYWCFEEYTHSRHGTGKHAQIARLRTQEILNLIANGTPVTAAPFGPIVASTICTATIASSVRKRAVHARADIAARAARAALAARAAPAPALRPGNHPYGITRSENLTPPAQSTSTPLPSPPLARLTPARHVYTLAPHLRPNRSFPSVPTPSNPLKTATNWWETPAGCQAKANDKLAAAVMWMADAEIAGLAEAEKHWFLEQARTKFREAELWRVWTGMLGGKEGGSLEGGLRERRIHNGMDRKGKGKERDLGVKVEEDFKREGL